MTLRMTEPTTNHRDRCCTACGSDVHTVVSDAPVPKDTEWYCINPPCRNWAGTHLDDPTEPDWIKAR